MPRPIWTGAISFGLVSVPVKLFAAVRHKDLRFHQLHAADGVRIVQRRVCPEDGQEVAFEDLVKGYEVAPGRYVVIQPDELEALDPQASHTVDIEDFVALEQIDPLYFDSSYYLVPDQAGAKAYRLLLDAISAAGKVGIGKVVMRNRQYLCALRPLGGALVLTTMNFADEVQSAESLEGLPGPEVVASEREIKMATQLIEALDGDWDPTRYQDTHRERVMELINAKVAGEEVVVGTAASVAPVIDLMAALEASLAQARARAAGPGSAGAGSADPGSADPGSADPGSAGAGSAGTDDRPASSTG
jgi:DNA end-binding protein Ku